MNSSIRRCSLIANSVLLVLLAAYGADCDDVSWSGGPVLRDETDMTSRWNAGLNDGAVAAPETSDSGPTIGMSGRKPNVNTQKRWYTDVRIGFPREDAEDVILDYHTGTNNIFAVVAWTDGWSLNISTDNGVSWTETYFWPKIHPHIGMAVAGDHAWVACVDNSGSSLVEMKRFHVSDGSYDGPYGTRVAADISPATALDVTVGSNTDEWGDRIFLALIDSNNGLRFYWDDLGGTTFTEMSPPVSDARRGLDYTWNTFGPVGYRVFLSYQDTNDQIDMWRADAFGFWDQALSNADTGIAYNRTSVSAFAGNVFIAYENEFPEGFGVKFQASYNSGNSWYEGSIYHPSPGGPTGTLGGISARSGLGTAAVYALDESGFDPTLFITRRAYAPGLWTEPVRFNEYIAGSLQPTILEWLGTSCLRSHGMVYLGLDAIPYFDVMTPRGFFCDGFESGNTDDWNTTAP